jgi:transposase-like protein
MKKSPRCPVCGSVNIKEVVGGNSADEADLAKKEGDITTGGNAIPNREPRWKCGDCYRKFAVADERAK